MGGRSRVGFPVRNDEVASAGWLGLALATRERNSCWRHERFVFKGLLYLVICLNISLTNPN